jgi:predicted RND superfamily exporter protein
MRISIEADKLPQADLRRLLAEVNASVSTRLPPGWAATVTGPVPLVQTMLDEIRSTQFNSFALAAVIVFAMIGIFFRNLNDVALATVPTLLPVLLTLGAMGAVGVQLNVGSAMVATVVVGIAVDNAIHLLSHYRSRRRQGVATAAACRAAVRRSGRALVTTSVAMTLGFFTLMLSPWKTIADFGLISGIAIAVASLTTLTVVPAFLSTWSRRKVQFRIEPKRASQRAWR